MAESEISLLQNYFSKNRSYRRGLLRLPDRGLIYIDDFWGSLAQQYDSAMSQLFLNRTVVPDRSNTNPKDYLSRLREDWALVQIFVHGGSTQHEFYMNNVQKEGTVTWSDIRGTDPHGFFYVLSSCWTGRYIEPNYIAGWYVFAKTYGLAAIAPTKPGDMQEFQKFYSTLRNENLGTAFRDWLADRIRNEESGNTYTSKYFYSFTILGDPTLFALPSKYPKAQYATVTTSNTPTSSSYATVSKTDAALTTYKTTSGSAVTEQIPSETKTTLGIVATAIAVAVLIAIVKKKSRSHRSGNGRA